MEPGPVFALGTAVAFAISDTFLRRGVYHAGESFTAMALSVFGGMFLFSVSLFITGEWEKIWSLSYRGLMLLGAAGVVHFVIGRFLAYNSVRLIGANRATAIVRTSTFYAVTLGVLLLKEPISVYLIVGVLCIVGGAMLVGTEGKASTAKIQGQGVFLGLGAALCWGVSGVLAKPAIGEIGSALAATFVSYAAASIAAVFVLLRQEQRAQLAQLRRASVVPLLVFTIFCSLAHLFKYIALGYSPVSVVNPLLSTGSLFLFLFSFLLNRKIEVFTGRVFLGIAATVTGAFILVR